MATHQHYTPAFRHQVLSDYLPNTRGHSFRALARKWAIPDHTSIQQWYDQWDGTKASLETQPKAGRKRTFTQAQSTKLILKPVLKAIEKGQEISYPEIHEKIIAKPQYSHISLRTVRREGRRQHGLKRKRTTNKLGLEGICSYMH
jgi:transposase-like protein